MAEKRQFLNLWGRSIGQLNKKITDVDIDLDQENESPSFDIIIEPTTNTERIPEDAEIRITIRRNLRIQKYYCGTMGAPQLPNEITNGNNLITKFGTEWKKAKWQIKFVNINEPGRVYAWTDPIRLVPLESQLEDGHGNALILIGMDENQYLTSEAWKMNFDDTMPAIIINKELPELKEKFKTLNLDSYLLMPEVFRHILDKLVEEHCENPIGSGNENWKEKWLVWVYDRVDSQLPESVDSKDDFVACMIWKENAITMLMEEIEQSNKIRAIIDGSEENDN